MKKNTGIDLNELPFDIWIFGIFLNNGLSLVDIAHFAQASKQTKKITDNPVLWKNLFLRDFDKEIFEHEKLTYKYLFQKNLKLQLISRYTKKDVPEFYSAHAKNFLNLILRKDRENFESSLKNLREELNNPTENHKENPSYFRRYDTIKSFYKLKFFNIAHIKKAQWALDLFYNHFKIEDKYFNLSTTGNSSQFSIVLAILCNQPTAKIKNQLNIVSLPLDRLNVNDSLNIFALNHTYFSLAVECGNFSLVKQFLETVKKLNTTDTEILKKIILYPLHNTDTTPLNLAILNSDTEILFYFLSLDVLELDKKLISDIFLACSDEPGNQVTNYLIEKKFLSQLDEPAKILLAQNIYEKFEAMNEKDKTVCWKNIALLGETTEEKIHLLKNSIPKEKSNLNEENALSKFITENYPENPSKKAKIMFTQGS